MQLGAVAEGSLQAIEVGGEGEASPAHFEAGALEKRLEILSLLEILFLLIRFRVGVLRWSHGMIVVARKIRCHGWATVEGISARSGLRAGGGEHVESFIQVEVKVEGRGRKK